MRSDRRSWIPWNNEPLIHSSDLYESIAVPTNERTKGQATKRSKSDTARSSKPYLIDIDTALDSSTTCDSQHPCINKCYMAFTITSNKLEISSFSSSDQAAVHQILQVCIEDDLSSCGVDGYDVTLAILRKNVSCRIAAMMNNKTCCQVCFYKRNYIIYI